jgi:hypothetical protein
VGVLALELELKLKEGGKYRLFRVEDRLRRESYIRILSISKTELLLERPSLYCPILRELEEVSLRGSLYIVFANSYILMFLRIMFVLSNSIRDLGYIREMSIDRERLVYRALGILD